MFNVIGKRSEIASETDSLVHVDFVDGALQLHTWISNYSGDNAVDEIVMQWDGDTEVGVEQRFTIPGIVDSMIEFNRHCGNKETVVFSESSRPMVEAMRAQLVEALARLDGISFAADLQPPGCTE